MTETPEERLEKLLKDRHAQGRIGPNLKGPDEPEPDDQGPPPEVRKALESIIERIRGAAKDNPKMEIRDLGHENTGDHTVGVFEVTLGNVPKVPENMIGVTADMTPLGLINDERVKQHADAIIRSYNAVSSEVAALGDDHPLHRFLVAMGAVVMRAGMAGAMVLGGQKGHAGVEGDDFQAAMIPSIGGALLAALRYGQRNPEALTLADGVDDSALSESVDKFLASLAEDPNKEEDGEG